MSKKGLIVTGYHGSMVDFSDLDSSRIKLEDIAMRLSRIKRFNGGTAISFSVAQHSLAMAKLVAMRGASPVIQQLALMHDMTEAFMGDMVRPLKKKFPTFSKMETALFEIICRELNVPNDFSTDYWAVISQSDRYMQVAEWYILNHRKFIDHAGAWAEEYPSLVFEGDNLIVNPQAELSITTYMPYQNLRVERTFITEWDRLTRLAGVYREQKAKQDVQSE